MSNDSSCSSSVNFSINSSSLFGSEVISEGVVSNFLLKVDLSGDGCSSHVKPVFVVGGKIAEAASLDKLNPFWGLEDCVLL